MQVKLTALGVTDDGQTVVRGNGSVTCRGLGITAGPNGPHEQRISFRQGEEWTLLCYLSWGEKHQHSLGEGYRFSQGELIFVNLIYSLNFQERLENNKSLSRGILIFCFGISAKEYSRCRFGGKDFDEKLRIILLVDFFGIYSLTM